MESKKIYSVISFVFGLTFLYNLYWFFYSFIKYPSSVLEAGYMVRCIYTLIGIIGLIIFISSKFKRSNLFRLILCVEVMYTPLILLWYVVMFTSDSDQFAFRRQQFEWTFYVSIVLSIAVMISAIIGLRKLSINKVPKLDFYYIGTEREAQFAPVPGSTRFTNRIVDMLVIIYIIIVNIGILTNLFRLNIDIDDHPMFILVIEIPFVLLYYCILEGFFNTTAGKCVTGTTIVNETGERPGFGTILLRTFCRLIPFEALSFFGADARGWHDTITNTYVVQSVNLEDQGNDDILLDAEIQNMI